MRLYPGLFLGRMNLACYTGIGILSPEEAKREFKVTEHTLYRSHFKSIVGKKQYTQGGYDAAVRKHCTLENNYSLYH